MLTGRPLSLRRRGPGELLRSLGSLREGLHGPGRVWAFNGVLAVACALIWAFALHHFDSPAFEDGPHL